MTPLRIRFLVTGLACYCVCPGLLASGLAFDKVIDAPMYLDPQPPAARLKIEFVNAADLWLKALKRPEAELRYKAIQAIAIAHQHGVKGLEKTIAPLRMALEQPDQHPLVRQAAARALILLKARSAARNLWQQAQAGSAALRRLVEPALARWDFRPARAVWLQRLSEPPPFHSDLMLAVRALAQVKETKAAKPLRQLMLADQSSVAIRLEAARALGLLCPTGLEEDAEGVAKDSSARGPGARLAAAALLGRYSGDRAVHVLQGLSRDMEPAVAGRAASRLLEIDPKLLLPVVTKCLASPDPKLRAFAVVVLPWELTSQTPHVTGDPIELLANRLDDDHPDVRVKARQSLKKIAANKPYRGRVLTAAMAVLEESDWRGLEQATILLTQLDHKPAAQRLVELLSFDPKRPEVFVTAAWGLRKLAVPATLPGVVRYVRARQPQFRAATGGRGQVPIAETDHQLSQLNQFLGQQRYQPADTVLRQFVPRMERGLGGECRAAAIWALGLLHQGKPVPALVTAVEMRLNNEPPVTPSEDVRVRRMAAIALGRMQAKNTLPSLRKQFADQKPSLDPINNACGWAIHYLTNEPMPAPGTVVKVERDPFLIPLK